MDMPSCRHSDLESTDACITLQVRTNASNFLNEWKIAVKRAGSMVREYVRQDDNDGTH